ncbi:pyroglutamyl-peptidase I [Burkholderia sp. 3C]
MSTSTILVTGFAPFGGDAHNPSWDAARRVDGETLDGARVVARCLPCVFDEAGPALLAAIEHTAPALVLCLGLAAGRADVSVERVAINVIDARIPDTAGRQPIDVPVVAGGPVGYFSTLPIKALVRDLRAAGIPASVSQTAGTYACNAVFYTLLHHLAMQRMATRGGFVHLPCDPALAARHPGMPSLSVELQAQAIRVMAATALAVEHDVRVGEGAVQ